MGIGYGSAHLFAKEGARLAIGAREPRRLEEAAKRIHDETGGDVLPIPADMSKTEDVKRFVATAMDHFGRIDALVNVAGSAPGGLIENLTDEQWFEALNLKVMGYVRSIREVAPIMIRQGGGASARPKKWRWWSSCAPRPTPTLLAPWSASTALSARR